MRNHYGNDPALDTFDIAVTRADAETCRAEWSNFEPITKRHIVRCEINGCIETLRERRGKYDLEEIVAILFPWVNALQQVEIAAIIDIILINK